MMGERGPSLSHLLYGDRLSLPLSLHQQDDSGHSVRNPVQGRFVPREKVQDSRVMRKEEKISC
jgi:hypothetical protein